MDQRSAGRVQVEASFSLTTSSRRLNIGSHTEKSPGPSSKLGCSSNSHLGQSLLQQSYLSLSMAKKELLSSDSDNSDVEEGGASLNGTDLKVNESYARKFEHNKKREEKQRCMFLTEVFLE